MSVTRGGTAPNGLRAGGSAFGSAGSAGIVITLSARQLPLSRLHRQTEADRSSVLTRPWVDGTSGRIEPGPTAHRPTEMAFTRAATAARPRPRWGRRRWGWPGSPGTAAARTAAVRLAPLGA